MTGRPEMPALDDYRYRRHGPVHLYLGDAARVLAAMPDDSVDCLVTSPPFWGLRDYGTGRWDRGDPACPHPLGRTRRTDGVACPACQARWVDPQYGLETSLNDYLDHLVAVFDQARRVLAPTGTCWVNLGDSYSAGTRTAYDTTGGITGNRHLAAGRRPAPLPGKNLLGVPWRAAFALQASGWILRNAVVWAKPNPLPESVRDRLSATYELLFLFTKSPKYYFTLDPIRIPLVRPDAADGTRVFGGSHKGRTGGVDATARRRGTSTYGAAVKHTSEFTAGAGSGNLRAVGHAHTATHPAGRNPGDVWRIATRPYRGAHVAPFPIDLPLRAIAAGCPEGGLVLDPFCGAGTTGLAALQLGRRFAGIDVSSVFLDETLTRLTPHLPNPGRAG
ncbi:DNA-methyltransferase [Krasilnikovia sp. MM14-A1259]|uniref:DNA-methyltransferase n=1 Tax=Krasilnikovia sp. MM14-A1259 TaxID=3373539 RepID=UPI00380E0B14